MAKVSLYFIEHRDSHKLYVGKTIDPDQRWQAHRAYAASGRGNTSKLHAAMTKHGHDRFTFSIVEHYDTEEDAYEDENFYVEYLRAMGAELYNVAPGGRGGRSVKGTKLSDSHRRAIGLAHKGRPKGEHEKIASSLAQKGRKLTAEHRARIGEGMQGKRRGPYRTYRGLTRGT